MRRTEFRGMELKLKQGKLMKVADHHRQQVEEFVGKKIRNGYIIERHYLICLIEVGQVGCSF